MTTMATTPFLTRPLRSWRDVWLSLLERELKQWEADNAS